MLGTMAKDANRDRHPGRAKKGGEEELTFRFNRRLKSCALGSCHEPHEFLWENTAITFSIEKTAGATFFT